MTKTLTRLLAITAFLLPAGVHADVYRCVGGDGKTLYSDSPCPQESVRKLNITSDVGACTTAECEAKRSQQTADARERLNAEKQELQAMAQQRHQAELVRAQEARWQQAMEAKLAAMADDAVNGSEYPVYPIYPAPIVGRPCGWRCQQPSHHPHHRTERPAAHDGSKERGVAIKLRDR
jgi:hypothetical protein